MTPLDPQWIEKIYKTDTGEDFLGLRAVQANITGYLLPGIITITPRARYYSFYSWLLVEYGWHHPEGWGVSRFIKRRGQIFALANLVYQYSLQGSRRVLGLTGFDRLTEHLDRHKNASHIPLTVDNYVNASYGGYDAYAGVMRALGIAVEAEGTSGINIPPKGQALAEKFAQSIEDTKYFKDRSQYDTADSIPREVLLDYGGKCHLNNLADMPDQEPTIEALFCFDAGKMLPDPEGSAPTTANMRGTLGLMLDILAQAEKPIRDIEFREAVIFGGCKGYSNYQPASELRPVQGHWGMFQIRELYVYSLYALWSYFLYWLRIEGMQTLQGFKDHLSKQINIADSTKTLGLVLPSQSLGEWTLGQLAETILNHVNIPEGDFDTRCKEYAQQYDLAFNDSNLYFQLDNSDFNTPSLYVGTAALLLFSLYMRLRGLKVLDQHNAWYWAQFGGARRRSMDLYVDHWTVMINEGRSVLDFLHWIFRDYIIAQHTITSLEKWRQRKVNTFHFKYDEGIFEWVRNDGTGLSASRFRQAYDILFDMGLFEVDENNIPSLTELGRNTFNRVLDSIND